MVINFLVPLGKARGYFLRKSRGQYQNCFLPYSFYLRPPFAFTRQHCGMTPDDEVPESLRSPIHSLDRFQCMSISILQTPKPLFSLPHCLNSPPIGLLAFPWEQSTATVSKLIYASVSSSHNKNSFPYSWSPPVTLPQTVDILYDSFPTLKNYIWLFCTVFGSIYLQTFILPVLRAEYLCGEYQCLHTRQDWGRAAKVQASKGDYKESTKHLDFF